MNKITKIKTVLFIIMLSLFSFIAFADITCSESIIASQIGSNLVLTTDQTVGSWGVSIEATAVGGCTFPSGSTELKTVMLSPDGNSKSITMSNTDNCVVSGNYKFGECNVGTFDSVDFSSTACVDTYWLPEQSTICDETEFTQTSNCGTVRQNTGTKDCTTQIVCNEYLDVIISGDSLVLTTEGTTVGVSWGVVIEASATGGCTFPDGSTTYKSVMLSEDGNSKSITMSNTDNCVVSGKYAIAKAEGSCGEETFSKDFSGSSCVDTTWTPAASTVCDNTTFLQTSNCGNTKTISGTKDCSNVVCTDSIWTPAASTICDNVTATQVSNCGNTRSIQGTKDCTSSDIGDILSNYGGYIIAFFVLIIFLKILR